MSVDNRDWIMTATTRTSLASACTTAAGRTVICLAVWGVRWWGQAAVHGPPLTRTVLLDALLVALHVWTVAPIYTARGGQLPTREHWSFHFLTGVAVAVFFVVRDALYLLQGWSL